MNKLQQFFWFSAGVNITLLRKCPTEHNKYFALGATVVFTGLCAALSGGYALYDVFNDSVWYIRLMAAILLGLFWGALIYNLDRFLVLSIKKHHVWYKQWLMAVPRLALAGIIAIVISKPLELQIFHTGINYQLALMHQTEIKKQETAVQQRYHAEKTEYQQKLQLLKTEISNKAATRDSLATEARQEADGSGGSKQRGASVIYNIKKADAVNAQAEYIQTLAANTPQIKTLEAALHVQSQKILAEQTAIKPGRFDGFDKRLAALNQLTDNDNSIALAHTFIMWLFFAIETAPVWVKLMSGRGPYDDLLQLHEHHFEV
ncbi:MAG TPA: DUF4407 domain-containing protein, partial [Bacteroidia bacterium]|nr:DUF4407 domain-containing protein [Bacteroidia bacterium]